MAYIIGDKVEDTLEDTTPTCPHCGRVETNGPYTIYGQTHPLQNTEHITDVCCKRRATEILSDWRNSYPCGGFAYSYDHTYNKILRK